MSDENSVLNRGFATTSSPGPQEVSPRAVVRTLMAARGDHTSVLVTH
jgi:hypothetical protein